MKKIFISYSRQDKKWKDRLVKQLRVVHKLAKFDIWDDSRIQAGDSWYQEIETALNEADAAILLVSADFLTSDFIQKKEIPRLLNRRAEEGIKILPLIVKPCVWEEHKWLTELQVRPQKGSPLSAGSDHEIDTELTEFVREVSRILSGDVSLKTPEKSTAKGEGLSQLKRFGQRMRLFTVVAAILLAVGLALAWYFLRVPPEVKTHLTAGNQFLNQGLYGVAEDRFRKAIQIDRSNADAHKGLQKIDLYRLVKSDKDPVVVEAEIQQFLEQNPDDPHAYLFLGDLFANSEPAIALENYQKAVDIDPGLAEAWFSLGYVHGTYFEDYDKALKEYRRAVALSPHDSRYVTNLASMLCKMEKFKACIENYEKVIDLYPYSFITHVKLIEVLRLLGKVSRSVPYVKALAKFAEDDTNWQKPINQELWAIAVNDRNGKVNYIQLQDVSEKKFYVFCQISLTFFLLGLEDEGREYARKARTVESVDKETLIKLIAWDIHRLKENQPQFSGQLENCWEVLPIK